VNNVNTLTAILIVLLGGLFGWILGRLRDQVVYLIAGATLLLAIVVLTQH